MIDDEGDVKAVMQNIDLQTNQDDDDDDIDILDKE
jgi:hypothetical protein